MTEVEIVKILENHNTRINSLEERMDKMEKVQNQILELTRSVDKLSIAVENMVKVQQMQAERIEKIESQPAENWKTMTKTMVTVVISALVGAAMCKVFGI